MVRENLPEVIERERTRIRKELLVKNRPKSILQIQDKVVRDHTKNNFLKNLRTKDAPKKIKENRQPQVTI